MKSTIKKIFKILGFQVSKINVTNSVPYQIVQALKTHDINLVFDVGANEGQFASELRQFGYTGRIVSFEPLPDAYEILTKRAAGDVDWIVHSRCAVGEKVDLIEINVAANSVSSSILQMLTTHENAEPLSKYTHKQIVNLITLDSVYEQYCKYDDSVFLKIDTQGYESQVLDGATIALNHCKGILLELSMVPLYQGQALWFELIKRLDVTQHLLYAIQPGFTNLATGQTLQIDGLFFRK
jgi:FkbM family methyltransferase